MATSVMFGMDDIPGCFKAGHSRPFRGLTRLARGGWSKSRAKISPLIDRQPPRFAVMAKVLLSTTMMWPAPARLAGAFAACGATVEALAPRRHPIGESKALAKLHPYRPLQAISGLRNALEA